MANSEVRSMRMIQLAICILKMKEALYQENEDLSLTTTNNWILSTVKMSSGMSSLEPSENNVHLPNFDFRLVRP